ncbi:hypothetical protein [Gemmobacter denitrificans]|uniref:Flagellar protein FlgN n=1 Tax=Gemmobacter denitrificans TaxID=3123040 RepID=A0ABU8BVB9_9RHOB
MTRLEELLDQLRAAILAGDFAAFEGIEAALDEAAVEPIPDEDLARLHHKTRENARLMRACGRGLRMAQRRLTEISRARDGFATYDGQGKLQPHGHGLNALNRRF